MFQRLQTIVFGLAFSCCGLIFLLFMAQRTDLDCRRVEPNLMNCQVKTSLLGLTPIGTQDISGLIDAEVAENCDSDGCTYRVELHTTRGKMPLTSYYSSGEESKRALADKINRFVQEGSTESISLRVYAGEGFGLIGLIPIAFMLLGVGIFVYGFIFRGSLRR
jgi:hypothetical protein